MSALQLEHSSARARNQRAFLPNRVANVCQLDPGHRNPQAESPHWLPTNSAEPQVLAEALCCTSHPFASLPSQLEKPELHDVSVQVPVEQLALALVREHGTPQLPQSVNVLSEVSQPMPGLPSQLPQPELQVGWHVPDEQAVVPFGLVHARPQAPQLLTSLARLRQKPEQQALLAHWELRVQACPSLLRHCPPLQENPGAQFVEEAQVVRQDPVAPSQAYGLQSCVPPSTHVPEPSQTSGRFDVVAPEQEATAQVVPSGCSWQDRAPLQAPVVPQVDAEVVGHSSWGSVPVGIGSQNPARPARWQASHTPAHADAQQTPSAQKPEAHSEAAAQVCPGGFRQSPPEQTKPVAHWLFSVQVA